MKVYIGPYRSWIGPYQIAEKILFWLDKHEDERVHNFGEWLAGKDDHDTWLTKLCQWIHDKKQRKIKVHIDGYDVWSMDYTLALIALPMLKKLQVSKHGAPCVDDEDVPVELKSTSAAPKENEWDTDANHFKRWDWVIEEMIFAFECKVDQDWDIKFYDEKTGNWDSEKRQLVQNRVTNGFRLFGKYYESLWD